MKKGGTIYSTLITHDYIRRIDELIHGDSHITTDRLSSTLLFDKDSNNTRWVARLFQGRCSFVATKTDRRTKGGK